MDRWNVKKCAMLRPIEPRITGLTPIRLGIGGIRELKLVPNLIGLEFGLPVPENYYIALTPLGLVSSENQAYLPLSASNILPLSTNLASPNKLLMTILGLQSFGCFCAERRFKATHGWAPGFDKSRSDSHENIGNQQRSHTLQYHKWPWSAAVKKIKIVVDVARLCNSIKG